MIDGARLTFGFEGIWQGTALLYDHQTKSLWMHLTGECIEGEHLGRVLKRTPSGRHTTWRDWRALHPASDVMELDRKLVDQPADRGYFPRDASRSGAAYLPPPFKPTIQTRDDRLGLHDLLYGIVLGTLQRAYPFKKLQTHGVVEEEVAKVPVTVWYDAGSRSAAAFDRRVDGTVYTFVPAKGSRMHDEQTKSAWTMDGLCVDGPLEGTRLTPLRGLMSEWYGWYANYPKTSVWGL